MEMVLGLLANLFYVIANSGVNTTCIGPAYQPKEPTALDELKKLK